MSEVARERTFVSACLEGEAILEDVDDWAEAWSDTWAAAAAASEHYPELSEYLGMTSSEYELWVEKPSALRFIIAAHRHEIDVFALMGRSDDYALAARSESPSEAQEVLRWLSRTGRLDGWREASGGDRDDLA